MQLDPAMLKFQNESNTSLAFIMKKSLFLSAAFISILNFTSSLSAGFSDGETSQGTIPAKPVNLDERLNEELQFCLGHIDKRLGELGREISNLEQSVPKYNRLNQQNPTVHDDLASRIREELKLLAVRKLYAAALSQREDEDLRRDFKRDMTLFDDLFEVKDHQVFRPKPKDRRMNPYFYKSHNRRWKRPDAVDGDALISDSFDLRIARALKATPQELEVITTVIDRLIQSRLATIEVKKANYWDPKIIEHDANQFLKYRSRIVWLRKSD